MLDDAELRGVQLHVSTCGAAHALEVAFTRHTVHTDAYAVVCSGAQPGQRLSGSASWSVGRLSLDACGSSDFADVRESSCSAALELPLATARAALSEASGEREALLELQSRERSGRRYGASVLLPSCEPGRLQLRRTERRGPQCMRSTRLVVDAAGGLQLRWEQRLDRAEQGDDGHCVDLRRSAVGALELACALTRPLSYATLRCSSSLGTQAPPEATLKLSAPRLSVALRQQHRKAPSLLLKVQRREVHPPEEAKRARCALSAGWDADDGPTLEIEADDRRARLTVELTRTRIFAACALGTLA